MNVILLPIRKEHSDKIFNGIKKFEFRRNFPKSGVDKILVYESHGAGMVVGELEVEEILNLRPDELWQVAGDGSGIGVRLFKEYFQGRDAGYAIRIGNTVRYEKDKPLTQFGLKSAPQNYVWVERGK